MPQFDFATFFVQAFWLTIGLSVFFVTYVKFILTLTFTTLRLREKLVLSSLKKMGQHLKASVIVNLFSRI